MDEVGLDGRPLEVVLDLELILVCSPLVPLLTGFEFKLLGLETSRFKLGRIIYLKKTLSWDFLGGSNHHFCLLPITYRRIHTKRTF